MTIKSSKLKPKDMRGEWLFTDGGVLPASTHDKSVGSWAFRQIGIEGQVKGEGSGLVHPEEAGLTGNITSAVAEFYAMVKGMENLHDAWSGRIALDSTAAITWAKQRRGR